MSWLVPHAEEPTHEEFVTIWLQSQSPSQVSKRLAELGYVDMTPEVCLNWFRSLRSLGVKLRPHRSRSIHIQEANNLFLATVAC